MICHPSNPASRQMTAMVSFGVAAITAFIKRQSLNNSYL
jgi:hypothetical protein